VGSVQKARVDSSARASIRAFGVLSVFTGVC